MIKLRSTSLRFRLMRLIVLGMLPIIGLMFYHASMERDRKLRELNDEAVRMTKLAAGSVGKVIEGSRQMLLFLAYAEPVRTMNAPAASTLLAELAVQSKHCAVLSLTQADGRIVACSLPIDRPVYVTERPWFNRLQQTHGFAIGEYQIGKLTGKPTLNLAFPLPGQSKDQPMAAVIAGLNLDILQECIALPQLPSKAVILVVDRNGTYLTRNPDHAKWIGTKSHSWAALQAKGGGTDGFVETTGVDGIDRFYHYEPVPGSDSGLFVAVGISKAEVLAESRAGFLRTLLLLFLFTAVALLGAGLAARQSVLKDVGNLIEAAQRLAKGDWDVRPKITEGAFELQQLGQSFVEMADSLREHQDHLEKLVEQRTRELSRTNNALGSEIEIRKTREEELHKVNRTLKALTNSSEAMMRSANEPEYLKKVCKILAEDCGYALVWIGFAEENDAKTIRPVAYAGFEEGYLENLKLSWADTEYGKGPAGTGIRTGKPCKCVNIPIDPVFAPWREEAIKRGYSSTLTVPLLLGNGKAFGDVAVYAKEPDAFTDEETKLLIQLADDLAYGIEKIRLRVAREKAEEEEKRQTELTLRTQKGLLEISKLANEDVDVFVEQVIKIDAATLGIERVSIWWISENNSEIICSKRFDCRTGMETDPIRLQKENFPRYFAALEGSLTIDACDVRSDERTTEIAPDYLDKQEITSMLDLPIYRNGKIVGILSHEHRGMPRVWASIERDFAASITDFIVAALEAHARRMAEAEKERLLLEVQDALAHVKTLSGLLPICSGCKKIRDDSGYWSAIESYISQHSEAQFSHSLCPECTKHYFPEYDGIID